MRGGAVSGAGGAADPAPWEAAGKRVEPLDWSDFAECARVRRDDGRDGAALPVGQGTLPIL